MPPIITIDISPCQNNVEAHHSTHKFTTLLNNDQLILVEVQGTLEYNISTNETQTIKLGDISWDEKVSCKMRDAKIQSHHEHIYTSDIIGW